MWLWMAVSLANPGPFAGTWEFAGSEAEKTARTEVVESGAQRFNFAIRPIARGKLNHACALDQTLTVTGEPGTVNLVFTGPNPRESGGPSDGTEIELRGSMVGFKVDGTTMTIAGHSKDGSKTSVYKIIADGQMTATHTLAGKLLGDPPLVWTVSYRKK